MRTINNLVLHHSVTDPNNKDIWAVSVEGHDFHEGYYIDGQLYKGNYHYLVYQDGEVKHPVSDDWYTYHCGVYDINLTSLAICFIGNFEINEPSKESLVAAKQLIEKLDNQYKIENVYLHRDLFQTACPGKNITLDKIMEAQMAMTSTQIDQGYLSVLRRHVDPEGLKAYLKYNKSYSDFLIELAESEEHREMYNDAVKYRTSHTDKYEEIKDKLYKKI